MRKKILHKSLQWTAEKAINDDIYYIYDDTDCLVLTVSEMDAEGLGFKIIDYINSEIPNLGQAEQEPNKVELVPLDVENASQTIASRLITAGLASDDLSKVVAKCIENDLSKYGVPTQKKYNDKYLSDFVKKHKLDWGNDAEAYFTCLGILNLFINQEGMRTRGDME